MPYIAIRTNKKIDKEKEIRIKERLGEAISIVGKSESWLMIEFKSECTMYFKGLDTEDIAYVGVNLYGRGNSESYNKMTGVITEILNSELGIKPDNIYVSYQEFDNWGWNGSNF